LRLSENAFSFDSPEFRRWHPPPNRQLPSTSSPAIRLIDRSIAGYKGAPVDSEITYIHFIQLGLDLGLDFGAVAGEGDFGGGLTERKTLPPFSSTTSALIKSATVSPFAFSD
jgi:hypothetical protein